MTIKFFMLAFFISCIANAQVIEKDVKFYLLGNNEITLSPVEINILSGGETKFRKDLNGVKSFIVSPESDYLLISNYAFIESAPQFEISHFIFNNKAEIINELKINSESDMPHPLFKITDDGKLYSFDPLLLKIKIYDGGETSEIHLEKDIPFEMERAAFFQVHKGSIYVLISVEPLQITSNNENAALYKVDLQSLSIVKEVINLSVPSLLYADDESVYVSGIKFNNSVPSGVTFRMDNSLSTLTATDMKINKVISYQGGVFASTDNSILKLKSDLTAEEGYSLRGSERFEDVTHSGKNFKALIKDEKTCSIITLDEHLNLVNRAVLEINNMFDFATINSHEDDVLIHTNSKTYIVK